jgi:hypothetical protein
MQHLIPLASKKGSASCELAVQMQTKKNRMNRK